MKRTTIILSDNKKYVIQHNIGNMIHGAFDNWIARLDSDREEEWFHKETAENFCKYIISKDTINHKAIVINN